MEETQKISIDEFKKIEIKIGQIKSAEKVVDANKLLRLEVDFGDHTRQIVSGISEYFENPTDLIGKKCPFVTNLEPRIIRGIESNGMIMAAADRENNKLSLLSVDEIIPAGTKIS
jgi:methionine--tRNA ligase beta chain